MKKLMFILMAAAVMSCGDGSNRSSERDDDATNTDVDKTEQAAPDTATNGGVHSDTTSMFDRDRDAEVNNPDNSGKTGTSGTKEKESRSKTGSSQKDSIK